MGQAPGAEVARSAATRAPRSHESPRPERPGRTIRRTSPSGATERATSSLRWRCHRRGVERCRTAELPTDTMPTRPPPEVAQHAAPPMPESRIWPPSNRSDGRTCDLGRAREASEGSGDQDPAAPDRRPDNPIRREPPRPTARDPVRARASARGRTTRRARASARGRATRRTRDAHVARSAAAGRSERQNMRPRPPNERHAAVHDQQLIDRDRAARVAAGLAASASPPEIAQHAATPTPRSHEPSPQDGPGGSPPDLGNRPPHARCRGRANRCRTAAPTNATTDQGRTRNERSRAHAAGVEPRRFELLTSALQRQRSTN